MSSPAVSIIVASYNYEQWLPQALQSALDQYVADFELLVVDDGSADGSPAVAREFAARDARVRVLTHADGGNHGLPATLALGLAAARGQWTAFLEADDVWLPDTLSLRLAAAAGTDAGIIFNDVELWPMPGAATGWFTGYVPRVMAGHARRGGAGQWDFSLCAPMLVENVIPTFSCAMVRTELLRACDWQSPCRAGRTGGCGASWPAAPAFSLCRTGSCAGACMRAASITAWAAATCTITPAWAGAWPVCWGRSSRPGAGGAGCGTCACPPRCGWRYAWAAWSCTRARAGACGRWRSVWAGAHGDAPVRICPLQCPGGIFWAQTCSRIWHAGQKNDRRGRKNAFLCHMTYRWWTDGCHAGSW